MRLLILSVAVSLILMCAPIRASYTNKSLLHEVDAVLQQIDAHHGMHHEIPAAKNEQQPKEQRTAQVKPQPQSKGKPRIASQTEIVLAKQKIQAAEQEISKLKEALSRLENEDTQGPKQEKIERIIHLNKGLIQTYDRTLRIFEDQGIQPRSGSVELIRKKRDHAYHEMGQMQNQLRVTRNVDTASTYVHGDHAFDYENYDVSAATSHGVHRHTPAFMAAHGFHAAHLDTSLFKLSPFGMIQYEPFVATRRMTAIQLYQVYLLPDARFNDANFEDIKAQANVQLTGAHTHFGVLVEAPKVFGAIPSADISIEYLNALAVNYFPETSVSNVEATNGILFVHPSIYMDWECTSLRFGYSWHPMYDPEIDVCLSRATYIGTLAEPLDWFAQIRVTQRINKNFEFIAAGCSKIDEKARKNLGINPEALHNVALYDLHVQGRVHYCDHIFALGADIQNVQPRLFDEFYMVLDFEQTQDTIITPTQVLAQNNLFKTRASATSFCIMAFAKLAFDNIVFKGKTIIGSNISTPTGGYAVVQRREVLDTNGNPTALGTCYEPLRFVSGDIDLSVPCKIEPGIFVGFTKNLGTKKPLFRFSPTDNNGDRVGNNSFLIYRIKPDLDYTITISPRVKWYIDPIMIGGEVEYLRASYGQIDRHGEICCGVPVDCVRFLVSFTYNF